MGYLLWVIPKDDVMSVCLSAVEIIPSGSRFKKPFLIPHLQKGTIFQPKKARKKNEERKWQRLAVNSHFYHCDFWRGKWLLMPVWRVNLNQWTNGQWDCSSGTWQKNYISDSVEELSRQLIGFHQSLVSGCRIVQEIENNLSARMQLQRLPNYEQDAMRNHNHCKFMKQPNSTTTVSWKFVETLFCLTLGGSDNAQAWQFYNHIW